MSDLVPTLKLMTVAITALSVYSTVDNYNNVKPELISTNHAKRILVDKSFILGTGIILSILSFLNLLLLHYVYSYKGNNILYRFAGFLIAGAFILLGGYLLGEYVGIKYLKGTDAEVTDEVFPEDNLNVGYALTGIAIGTGFFMMIQILLYVGAKNKLKL